MDSFPKILNLLDLPSTIHKEIIWLYNHSTDNEQDTCNLECTLNNETNTTLKESLTTMPYETSTIIQKLKFAYNIKHDKPFEDIIATTIINYVKLFAQDTQNEIDPSVIYSLISLLELCDDQKTVLSLIFPEICDLAEKGKLNKDIVYLSLLPQNNLEILNELLKYEREHFNNCDLKDSTSLYRYCLYKNRHWLFHIIENDIDINLLSHDIVYKLLMLKLNHFTNIEPINIKYIETIVSKCVTSDTFLQNYITEIKWSLNLYKYISKINPKCRKNFKLTELKSCLEILSSYMSLKDTKYYEEINEILIKHERYLNEIQHIKKTDTNYKSVSELDLYNGFCILSVIEYYIAENKNENFIQERVQELLQKIKQQFLQSKNIDFQLEIFENLFSLLFLQTNHINPENTEDISFLCGKKEIYYISTIIKVTLKEIKRKHFSGKTERQSKSFARLTCLQNYVNDTLWRLELLKSLNILEEDTKNVINFMLSSPNTLIYLCLGNDNFEKVHEIIEVYKMEQTSIAQEIEFIERIRYLKSAQNINSSEIVQFCNENKFVDDDIFKETLTKYSNNEMIKSLTVENEIFMNVIDVALTLNNNYEISKELFDAASKIKNMEDSESCSYVKFCYNILKVFNNLGTKEKLPISSILNSIKYPLNINELQNQQSYYKNLENTYEEFKQLRPSGSPGIFNNEHICQQSFVKLMEICTNQNNYLYRLYNYLKLFTEILFVKSDNSNILSEGKDSCFFDIIYKNPAEIVGKLLTKGLIPKDLEILFANLKLDIIYHISWNCLPEIDLKINTFSTLDTVINKDNFQDFLDDMKQIYCTENIVETNLIKPDKFLLSYIRKRNWLLAYLINKVYLIEEAKPDTNSDRTKYFNNFINLQSIKTVQKLFNNNNALTALYFEIPMCKLITFLENIQSTNEQTDWREILDIIDSIPERMLFENDNLIRLRDFVMYNLVCNGRTIQDWTLIEWINDNDLRTKCILENLNQWPGNFCIETLNCQLSRSGLNVQQKQDLQVWFYQIELYENIKTTFNLESWNEVYEKSKNDPKEVFLLLLTSKQILLLLKWIEIQKPKSTDLLHLITTSYFKLILNEDTDLNHVKTLLDLLQFDQRIQICKDLMRTIRKLEFLDFIINYLVTLLPELESEYKNVIISLKIFTCFNSAEHEYLFCLINKPLLILEQLIMNVRLEKLSVVLEKIKPLLKDSEEKNISVDLSFDSIDILLRTYAKKSLDFRGIQPAASLKSLELKLMQSLDTVSVDSERKVFVIPEKVPDKSDWVQNDQALECMCCHEVTFSMFNRRHHCRRCGRVVCGNCSHKTMEIPEYGSIPVRICNDCFKHSQPEDPNVSLKSEYSSNKSGSLACWLLNDDDKHNDIVREEFSYEYAPSVSLCLSILKAHTNSIECPRFLLEQCKELLPYLQDAVSEIDFSFVIQMIKSLVTVAKMTSLHHSFKAELSQCYEMFLHIELLKLLVEKDCLEFLRSTNKNFSGDFYINAGVLRRLRDKLIEQEQWPLALEVSTKVGLDKTGIFAAWGKSCLKAGCLQQAREKFQYCLEKNTHYDTSLDLSISFDPEDFRTKSHLKSVTLSTVSEGRIIKTPPLVNEIISVLESNGKITDRSVFKTFEKSNFNVIMSSSTLSLNTSCGTSYDPAVCILNKLKNLKNITGQTQSRSRKNSKVSVDRTMSNKFYIETCFYNECLYYLMRYASHSSILHFYIRHEEIDDALNYILENRLQSDIFIDIYMKCLEDGKVEQLQEHMHKIDSTLNVWEIYLRSICRHLETNSMFNVLYQLQIFMSDYVRAAMTCIKFYHQNATSFKELLDREEYLYKAQLHLKQELEQEQWVQVVSARKQSSASSGSSQRSNQPSLIMKIDPRNIDKYINTIWRQIEIAKFLAECEMENRPTLEVLNEIFTFTDVEKITEISENKVPTLFDTQLEKTKLAVLSVVCGKNVEEGFGIAFRIIQDHNLKYLKIYCLAGKYLAQILREDAVTELIKCIQSSGLNIDAVNETCDEVLIIAVAALTKANGTGVQLENLIKLIYDNSIKIDAYIESKQLKRAYLLAIRYNKISDIKKILREAERLNQPQIKAICLKRLNQSN